MEKTTKVIVSISLVMVLLLSIGIVYFKYIKPKMDKKKEDLKLKEAESLSKSITTPVLETNTPVIDLEEKPKDYKVGLGGQVFEIRTSLATA